MKALLDRYLDRIQYLLSLPERTLRSLAAILTGALLILSDTLLPDFLQKTTL
jgi:hypothetical protein